MTPPSDRAKGLATLESEHLIAPVSPHDTELSDGARQPIVRPSGEGELQQVLEILSEHRMSCLIRGGGSRLEIGNSTGEMDVVLETGGLSGVTDFERDDGVVRVRAGTPLAVVREQVCAEGWELRLDSAGDSATVGGTLAAAAIGPRSLGFGRPRDCVLGLDVTLASGEQTRCGGRVVKNVTGYDMAKLYTGSFGTLGVIASAWLKLAPIPETRQLLAASSISFENMFSFALDASRRTSASAAVLVSPAAARTAEVSTADRREHWVLVLELAGDEPAVRGDAQWLRDQSIDRSGGARGQAIGVVELVETPALSGAQLPAIDRLRSLQAGTLEDGGVRARIAALPSSLRSVVGGVSQACPALILYPGMGLLYAYSPPGPQAETAALEACRQVAQQVGGSLMLERLPEPAKAGLDVFGAHGRELALMRDLKQRFDPTGVLNPGRFAGGI
jgi:glycolate oxidase FAD binding subunit